jgi:hypothetical protein
MKIVNYCYPNLNQNAIEEQLGEDITTELTIGTSPIILLSIINTNRRLIKLFTIQYSNPSTKLWVRHGVGVSASNSSFALPENRLYENSSQASRPLSVVTSLGTALLRFTVVNKL